MRKYTTCLVRLTVMDRQALDANIIYLEVEGTKIEISLNIFKRQMCDW